MSTIFASDFALKGIAPNTGRWNRLDLKPRAVARAIGGELHNADTMTFQRIRTAEADAARCDIPWCVDDFKPDVDTNPEDARLFGAVHMHYGVRKHVELHSYERSHEDAEAHDHSTIAEVRIMRFDDDDPITPTVGDAQVYVEGIGSDPIQPADLLRLTRVIEGQAHIAAESNGRRDLAGRHAVAIPEHTGTCYLPWCTDCEEHSDYNLSVGDFGCLHIGAEVEVDVEGTSLVDKYKIKVALERGDRDADDDPDGPPTGETRVYLNVATNGMYTDGESMTFEQAEQLRDALTNVIRTGRAHDALRNPNRVTPQQIAAAIERRDGR